MEMAGGDAAFFDPSNATARRAVIDAALDRADHLVDIARELPSHVKSRRLAAESVVTIAAADKLGETPSATSETLRPKRDAIAPSGPRPARTRCLAGRVQDCRRHARIGRCKRGSALSKAKSSCADQAAKVSGRTSGACLATRASDRD